MSKSNRKKVYTAEELFGEPAEKGSVLKSLREHPEIFRKYRELNTIMQDQVIEFLSGERSLEILYDNFFMKIFNPEEHRERVESLISAMLGQRVKIKDVLSREGSQIVDRGSFVIMDIIVELEDGSFVDVEMQKTGYRFPEQRSSCYVSDMIMRQYNRKRDEAGESFSYKDITPVYLFVLMESPSEEFRGSSEYLHRRKVTYTSGVKLPETARITYISLDAFRESVENIDNELDAWLTFLIKDDLPSVLKLVNAYPEFAGIYHEIAEFRRDPKELIGMFSEALYIMDKNTERYMIDELKERCNEAEQRADEAKQKANEAEQRADEAKQQADEAEEKNIKIFIADKREDGIPDDVTKSKLMRHYNLSEAEADKYLLMK